MSQVADTLSVARESAARRAWSDAYAAYASADESDLTPADLERFGEAAWWTARRDEAMSLRQRAYAAYLAAGEKPAAARVAIGLAWDHLANGALAVYRGWLAKAERLVESTPESVEHGYVVVTRGFGALFGEGDLSAVDDMDRAYELSQRFGSREVEAMALVGKGKVLVAQGDVEGGLALLDEATAAATGGELEPFAAGFVYCCTIDSCHELGDFRRAAEWTDAANRWCDRLDIKGMPGACRIHRASIMRVLGNWSEAEEQALSACEELSEFNRFVTALGHYEIGEIRRQRGDFAAAEEAYAKANEWGHPPQPGHALLRLAEGKLDSARAGLSRALEEVEIPLPRVPLLAAKVEIELAGGGSPRAARAAADELVQIVDSFKLGERRAPIFDATVNLAEGRIKLAEGDLQAAIRHLRRAREIWQEIGAPYETGQVRMLLGLAFRRDGNEDAATSELEASLATFERLGARLDEERIQELLGRLEARRTFLFTDIVNSTRLLETLGDEKWRRLLARHDELVRERIGQSGGEVIKHTGDGFFASFDSAKGAVEAAIAIQRALAAEIVAPDVRIGAHTGGAFLTDADFRDYGGQGVHTAARIGAAAGPAEILVSRETLDGVGAAFRVSEPREEALKGFDRPVEVVSIDWR
jgi:class 3 adenylate cyclase